MDNEQNKKPDENTYQTAAETHPPASPTPLAEAGTDLNSQSDDETQQQKQPPKHSGLGIASFVLAMISVVLTIIVILTMINLGSGLMEQIAVGETMTEEQLLEQAPGLVIVGLLFMAVAVISLIGGILGIVGLFQKNRKKLFAILGTVFNLLGWVLFFVLFIVGIAMQAAI
jgi:predicted anti-sigma-YlaC factor YlaD